MSGLCRVTWRNPVEGGPAWTQHLVVDVVDAAAARALAASLIARGAEDVHWWEVASEGE